MHDPLDPAAWTRRFALKDGTPVLIRPVRLDDRERIVRAFSELEPATIYTRFFSSKRELTDSDLARIAGSDFVHALALVATIERDGDEVIIGGGAYTLVDRPDEPLTAEVSFTIEEDYQGQGLAGRLMATLIDAGRARGIARFEAEVLGDNAPMLAVFGRSGLPQTRRLAGGIVQVLMDLRADAGAGPSAGAGSG